MDDVRIEDRNGVRWIELNRPKSRNGLTIEVNKRIIAAIREIKKLQDIRVLVLAGAGGAFCSGLDLKDALERGMTPASVEPNLREHFHGLIRALRSADVPAIAAVDGPAVGYGCDLALACDVRFVSERATFAELFVRNGLMPDGGGTFMLPRIIGLGRAMELMLTGDKVSAEHAIAIGLANRLVPEEESIEDAVQAFAERLAAGPPLAYAALKRAVYASLDGGFDDALEREVTGQIKLIASNDFTEGVQAFIQKRPPKFTGE